MRMIKESRVKQFMHDQPRARKSLERWVRLTRKALWTRFPDVRDTFPDADEVAVASGKKAMIFDIHGNDFRLIAAVHYLRPERIPGATLVRWAAGRVYVFYFLTHAEYHANAWKETL